MKMQLPSKVLAELWRIIRSWPLTADQQVDCYTQLCTWLNERTQASRRLVLDLLDMAQELLDVLETADLEDSLLQQRSDLQNLMAVVRARIDA